MTGRRWLVAAGILAGWAVGAVVVRVGLDWADGFPYAAASEWRYLGVAVVALVIAVGGTLAAILLGRRTRGRFG
ncbi:MAG: hypothetical protein JWN36_2890, partial [Microbacteriaceae bacterium]|nr:hypothetical protein [Microbacteriaceae bacterium]